MENTNTLDRHYCYLDLIVVNQNNSSISTLMNNEDGSFANDVRYSVGDFPRQVELGDFDNDGFLDVVVSNANSDDCSVLINLGDGTFAPQVRHAANNKPEGIALGDIAEIKILTCWS